ncbi:MAG: response regulator, partial [Methanococcaceae archaeon]
MKSNNKILFVDDEINILSGYERSLRNKFTIVTSTSAKAGLEIIKKAEELSEPFSVIVSDFRMPEMDGTQFLSQVKLLAPDSV